MPAKNKTKPKPTTQSFEEPKEVNKKDLIRNIITKKPKEKFLNENQKKYYQLLKEKEITICSGSAGTGKSHLALRAAIDLILEPQTPYEKLIILRPAVEGGEQRLGYLKGTLREKLEPYMYPSFYLLNKILGDGIAAKLEFFNIIEIMSLSHVRGISIDGAILVVEEAQNCTPSEIKLILTRIGYNSKFFISGDIEQSDKYKNKSDSGLYDSMQRLKGIEEIGFFEFTEEDIVRNPIISKILKKY
jgi:phosphate starvation-inducible PhoH-like protein